MSIDLKDDKVILLGDVHIGARSDSSLFHDYFEQFFIYLFEYMKTNDIKTIIQFGDLFDRRKYVNYVTLKRAREYLFDRLREHNLQMIVFLGNHDISYKNTLEVSSPNLLVAGYYDDCITVLDKPTEIQMQNTKAICIPWICAENYDSCIRAMADTDAKLCFGHFEIQGFEMYKGAVCDHGLDSNLFWKFDHVYSGHFHHISTNGNITYIGSPYQIMWSDYGDERGFFVLDTKSQEVSFEPNPYQMFHKLIYDDTVFGIDDMESINFSKYSGRYVKLIISSKRDLFLYDKFVEKLSSANAIVTAVDDHNHRDIETDAEISAEVEEFDEFMKKMAEQYASGSQTVDSNKLFGLLMNLYTEATNMQII